MSSNLVKVSKFLSYVLRHKPGDIGITLEEGGWVDLDLLIERAIKHGHRLDRHLVEKVVRENDKQRFSISDDGLKIRANQGHSIKVDLQLPEIEPPALLYHGTATRFIDSIKTKGLLPGSRHHVHLSSDEETAAAVGKRHGKPIVLVIDSCGMSKKGLKFYQSANGVWLTDSVSIEYILDVKEV